MDQPHGSQAPIVPPSLERTAPGSVTPPTVPGRIDAAAFEPTWPSVLGIFCLCYGVLVTFLAFLGLLSPLFMHVLAQFLPPEAVEQSMIAPTVQLVVLNTVYYLPTLVLNTVLCFVGYRLSKRRPSAPAHLTRWAWLKILVELIGAVTTFIATLASFRAQLKLQQSDGTPGAPAFLTSDTFAYGMAAWTSGWSFVVGIIVPIFLLIWFRRASVIQYVRTWTHLNQPELK